MVQLLECPPVLNRLGSGRSDGPVGTGREQGRIFAAKFKEKIRAEWLALFEGTDACVAPVLDLKEAYEHPHIKSRRTYIDVAGAM